MRVVVVVAFKGGARVRANLPHSTSLGQNKSVGATNVRADYAMDDDKDEEREGEDARRGEGEGGGGGQVVWWWWEKRRKGGKRTGCRTRKHKSRNS